MHPRIDAEVKGRSMASDVLLYHCPSYFFETLDLELSWQSASPRDLSVSLPPTALGLQIYTTAPGFLCGYQGFELRSSACIASMFTC